MKATREIVDFDRLRDNLKKNGFRGKTWSLTTGTIVQIGKKVENSLEPLGLILLDGDGQQTVGFRPSHQYIPHVTSRKPRLGDKVFVVPFRPPDNKRPYALSWGLLADLRKPENGYTKTQSFFGYMLATVRQAIQDWSKSES